MRGLHIHIIFFLAGMVAARAQVPDSTMIRGQEVIQQQAEQYEMAAETEILDDLTEWLEYRLEHPVNINDASKQDLRQLKLLNNIQVKNLLDYRDKYGRFYSIYELKAIEGLSRQSIEKIMPFVVVAPPDPQRPSLKKISSGSHELMLRVRRRLAGRQGFDIPDDSTQLAAPGAFYLGDPYRYYLRYRYRSGKHLSLGLTADKDEGEVFFSPEKEVIDTIRESLPRQYGFDFYSAHLEIKNIGWLRSLIIGDYQARFGQGLTLWSGVSFSGGSHPNTFKRYSPGIRPSTSASEYRFMRGIAIHLHWRSAELVLFYSRKKTDANLDSISPGQPMVITSLPETGYHRDLNEIGKENAVLQQHYGGHLSIARDHWRIGMTAYHTMFDHEYQPRNDPFRMFQFRGQKNINAGLNFEYLLQKTVLYGELAGSINGGWALLAGITHTSASGCVLGLQFREYRKNYQNLLSGAMGARSQNMNDRGLRLAISAPVHPEVDLLLSSAFITYPWITTRLINPYRGIKNEINMEYTPSRNTLVYLQYRHKKSVVGSTGQLVWFDQTLEERSHKLSFRVRQMLSPYLSLKTQASYVNIRQADNPAMGGTLLAFDLFYHPPKIPVKISFRYAVMNTADYAARLYAYEHDVLYASSFPAYHGKGYRTYLLLNYSPFPWLDLWTRFALRGYTDRNTISSGKAEIHGHTLPEIKVQLRIKFSTYRRSKPYADQ